MHCIRTIRATSGHRSDTPKLIVLSVMEVGKRLRKETIRVMLNVPASVRCGVRDTGGKLSGIVYNMPSEWFPALRYIRTGSAATGWASETIALAIVTIATVTAGR